jgi:REP element-mobilizing transposase RayT
VIDVESLSHTKKSLYGELRRYLGSTFRELAMQRESRVIEGHLLPDHVHVLIWIPPKYAVAQVVGYLKGKSAIHIARTRRRLMKFHGLPRSTFYYHLKECEFRFNHRTGNIYRVLLNLLRKNPLS